MKVTNYNDVTHYMIYITLQIRFDVIQINYKYNSMLIRENSRTNQKNDGKMSVIRKDKRSEEQLLCSLLLDLTALCSLNNLEPQVRDQDTIRCNAYCNTNEQAEPESNKPR